MRRFCQGPLERKLFPGMGGPAEPRVDLTASQAERFHQLHGADQMAVDKLKVQPPAPSRPLWGYVGFDELRRFLEV